MTIQITYGTVTAAAGDISSAATQIHSQLEQLNGKVKKVVDTWDGNAQEAYQRQHMGWDRDVTGLKNTLDAIARALHDATDGYQHTDRKAAQQFEI